MSSGEHVEIHSDPLKLVDELDSLLLHDSSNEVVAYLKKSANSNMIIGKTFMLVRNSLYLISKLFLYKGSL